MQRNQVKVFNSTLKQFLVSEYILRHKVSIPIEELTVANVIKNSKAIWFRIISDGYFYIFYIAAGGAQLFVSTQ